MIRIVVVLCAMCTFQCVLGQTESFSLVPSHMNYGIDDGLPSKETYDIVQDSTGIIWVASDRGVASFNGYEFKTYTTADGLADNCVINMDIDSDDRIWLLGSNGLLTYGSEGVWQAASINEKLSDHNTFSRPVDMAIDSGDTIWIFYTSVSAGTYLVKYHQASGESQIISKELPNCPVLTKSFGEKSISALHFPYNNDPVEPYKKYKDVDGFGGVSSHINSLPTPLQRVGNKQIPAPSFVYGFSRTESDQFDDRKAISMGNMVYIINGEKVTSPFDAMGEVLDIRLEKDSLWLGIRKKGAALYVFENDSFVLKNRFLNTQSVSLVFRDRAGHMWFTTLNNGLVHMPKTSMYTTQLDELALTDVRKIRKYGDTNIILSGRGSFHVLRKGPEHFSLNHLKTYPKTHDFSVDQSGVIWPTGHKRVSALHMDGHSISGDAPRGMMVHIQNSDGLYAGARYNRAYIGKTSTIDGALMVFDLPSIRPRLFYEDTLNKCLLLGTSVGVFRMTTDSLWAWKPDQTFSRESVTAITQINSKYVIGTLGNGLFLQTSRDSFQNISRENGLLSNAINDLIVIDSSRLALASNQGVTILHMGDLQALSFTHLSVKNGLLSNDVQALGILDDHLVIGTALGLNFWELNSTSQAIDSINILIDKVVSGTRNLPVKTSYQIQENRDGLDFNFTGLNYAQNGNITYAYRLVPFNTNWITTRKRSIQFNSLPYGDYTLEISALDPTTKNVITRGKKISILVGRPFYRSPWFSFGLSLAIILIMAILSYIYVKMIKRQNHLHHQLLATEQNALKAQMNPHFLFNAMNSVQNFIAINDKKAAFTFIARFSQLVRSIVDNSSKKMVPLHEEMEGWKAYLELEKIRFDNKFDYHLYVNKAAAFKSQEIEIPGMLVQPLLENALLHGLRPLSHMGMLSINVVSDAEHLTISICDNGIGRKQSAENRKKLQHYHNSQGLQNIKKRIELLNKVQRVSIFFDIVDIDDDGKTGTLVILKFRTNDQYI